MPRQRGEAERASNEPGGAPAPAPDECRDSEAKPSARAMSQAGRLHIHVANAATAKEEHV
ncbi:hypothetical protein D5282_10565 [bacterium 1xD8-48]|nr:hypothetical protein [bacterium 1xD8-48]